MNKKILLVLVIILFYSAFMRFYNLNSFGYFTGDEEIFHSMVKKITVEGKPPLVIPNAQIGGSMGSFFIFLISPFFALLNNDPIKLQIVGPIFGVFSTLAIFWVGRLIGGVRVGLFSAILYSGSFMMVLSDRRLWTLTLDPLMIILSIGSVIKIVQKKYIFSLPLAIAISFTWHSDPAIAVATLASILVMLIFRVPFWKKEYIFALGYLFLSIIPLIVFEIRHPGTIFKPWFIHITSRSTVETTLVERLSSIHFINILQNLSRGLFVFPSTFIEQYLCYCADYPKPLFSPVIEVVVLGILIYSIYFIYKNKSDNQPLKILLVFILSFLLGVGLYTSILSYNVYQHYFVTVIPVFFLLISFVLNKLMKKISLFVYAFLLFFITINIWTLFNSSLKYPLADKDILVGKVSSKIEGSFSVYGIGSSIDIFDGGWVTFFAKNNLNPNRSYLNGGWDFLYRTHSLYTYNPDQKEGKEIVIFHDVEDDRLIKNETFSRRIKSELSQGEIAVTVLDNKDEWFNESLLK